MRFLVPLLAWAALVSTHPLHAETSVAKVAIELNKLEARGGGCQPYLVFENKTAIDFDSLKLDLVMFDKEGVIARRIAVEGAPLPPGKMAVKVFDLPDLSCAGIGRFLLNGLTRCADPEGDRAGCLAQIETRSRAADVGFIQ